MINNVFLVGRVGTKPEIKDVRDKRVATLSVATWENHKKGDEWTQVTEWHTIIVWGDAVNRVEKLNSGDLVAVEGKIRTRSWEKEGKTYYKTEILGIVRAMPKAKGVSSESNDMPEATNEAQIFPQHTEEQGIDDLPF